MARDIKIRITGDSSDLKSALGDAEGRLGSFGSKVGSVLGGMAKAGALLAGGGIVAAGAGIKSAVDAASDFNETMSKTNILFGEATEQIVAWADDAATNLGLSRQAAMDFAGTFAIFGKAMGLAGTDLATFSKDATKIGADLGSFYNTDTATAVEAIGAAMRGEAEPIRQFGIILGEDTLKATALSKGIVTASVDTAKFSARQETAQKAARKAAEALKKYGATSVEYTDAVRDQEQAEMALAAVMEGKVPELTQAQKMQATYAAIMDQSTVATDDFWETSDGLAGTQKKLAAEFANAKQELGAAFLPAAMAVADFLLTKLVPVLRDLNQWVQGVATTVRESGWGAAFGQVVEDVAGKVGSLASRAWDFLSANLPGWLALFGEWFANTAAPWLGERAVELGGKLSELAHWAWEKLKEKLPVWLEAFGQWFTETAVPWVIVKAEAIAAALADWVPKAWDATVEKLKEYLKKLEEWFENDASKTSEDGGGSMVEAFIRGLGKLWLSTQTTLAEWQGKVAHWFFTEGVPTFVKGVFELGVQLTATLQEIARNLLKAGVQIGKDIVQGVIDGIWSKAGELAGVLKEAIYNQIPEVIRKRLGIFSPSKVMMEIGGQIAEGLALGITGGQKLVTQAVDGLWSGPVGSSMAAVISRPAGGPMTIGGATFGAVSHLSGGGMVARGDPVGTGSSLSRRTGLGGDESGGGLSLSAVGLGGGSLTINLYGVVGERDAVLRWISEGLRRYGIAVG